jgi:aryl-alcohol dehydrogenase-like predicted oxidoreductase
MAARLIDLAIDQGINLIDTADFYAEGSTENVVGRALGRRRDRVLLATTIIARNHHMVNDGEPPGTQMTRALERSLRRLRTDCIDLCQVHVPDPLTPMEPILTALSDAVGQGKIRYIGASGIAARKNRHRDLVSLRCHYSIIERTIESESIPELTDGKAGLLAFTPLTGTPLPERIATTGALLRDRQDPAVRHRRDVTVVRLAQDVARRHGVTLSQAVLAWQLGKRVVSSTIVSPRRPLDLMLAVEALDSAIPQDELTRLDRSYEENSVALGPMIHFPCVDADHEGTLV